jgi:mono/diheme cytochrome c family protein
MLVIVVIVTVSSHVDYSQPNIEILPDMKYTPAWTAYRQSTVFANGRILQKPAPGTIARGQMPLYFEATKEDALRAGEELTNPYHSSDDDPTSLQESIQRGVDTYRVFCVSCHGATGVGDGSVTKRGFPPPPSLLTGNSLKMKDGQLFHILTYGGQTAMPNFAAQLSPGRRWDVINYIRSMQPNPDAPDNASPADPAVGDSQGTEIPSAESNEQKQDRAN